MVYRDVDPHRASGNSGIGKAIALELAEKGAKIVINDISDPNATEELEKQIASLGDQAIGVQADVSKIADLQRLIDATVKAFGRVDIMFNNGGIETAYIRTRDDRGTIRERAAGQS